MPIESTTENLNWTSLEGTVLGANYSLERFASADQNTASFDTRTGGEKSSKAVARLVAADGEAGESQIQLWQALRRSGHPHLLSILGAGRTQAEGHELIYVVVEAVDENLAGVLRDRPLEPAEAGEILVSLVGGLGHLHVHRWVHGSLSPEQIFAVGETVKLSTGGVRRIGACEGLDIHKAKYRAPESSERNITPAADIWCLGATLLEAFTQRACGPDCVEEAAKLPAPFDAIAMSCLQSDPGARGTLTQILALYEGTTAKRAMGAAAGAGAASGIVTPVRADEGSTNRTMEHEVPVPVYLAPGPIVPEADAFAAEAFSAAEDAPTGEVQRAEDVHREAIVDDATLIEGGGIEGGAVEQGAPTERRQAAAFRPEAGIPAQDAVARAKRRAWIFVAVALAILLAVVWLLRPSRSSNNRTLVHQTSSFPKEAKHGQTMTLPAAGQNGAPATAAADSTAVAQSAAPRSEKAQTAAGRGPIWRVILYTYHHAADAEKRVAAINNRHPGLQAEVFTPNGEGTSPYLVSLSGSQNREEEAQLRRKALQAGLPRDSYLQNYGR